jgi:hypothetical protein
MSQKYPGGFITKNPVAPTSSAASGIWTLDQQQQAQKAGTWPSPPIFIEDLFSTYLYTGNGSTQTITNGIDLSGQGGLVWSKSRSNALSNFLCDTVRGRAFYLYSDATVAQQGPSAADRDITSFNANGYSLGPNSNADINTNAATFVSWTFREQPKFFDIVTYSGSSSDQTISHNLGSTPGCIMIKKLDSNTFNAGWAVYHRSLANPNNNYLVLNTTAATANYGASFISSVSSTTFTVAGGAGSISLAGSTYVAYLFAHDAGGFPVSGGGSTNGISCGTFVTNGSGGLSSAVNLGYEAQWLLVKNSGASENWQIYDTMRGMSFGGYSVLYPNLSNAEVSSASVLVPTATGFNTPTGSGPFASFANYIYIAIRRGPMKTPTVGTSVFYPQAISQADNIDSTGVPFPPDLVNTFSRNGTGRSSTELFQFVDRLRGLGTPNNTFTASAPRLVSSDTAAENTGSSYVQLKADSQNITRGTGWNSASYGNWIDYFWRRAPSFFDEVCYTGTGSATTFTHNLGAVPEMMIVKARNGNATWAVYAAPLGATKYLQLENNDPSGTLSAFWNDTAPTSTVFTLGTASAINGVTTQGVAYLFATCAGVSKVGSYTGTGALQTINCGFTGGARFVLIRRTDSTGDWFTYDSARGITSGNDPYLLMNSTAAEVTGTNYVDTDTTGFKVTAAAPAGLNASGGTYIFLAVA